MEMKINFRSVYGYNRKLLSKQYGNILDTIWTEHFKELIEEYIRRIQSGETVILCDVALSSTDVTFKTSNFLNKSVETIPWEELGTKDYATYYALFSKNNPADINRGFYYLDDWNVYLLGQVIEKLLQANGSQPDSLCS